MTTAYKTLSDAIQIAAATGNNEQLLELEGIVDGAYTSNELTLDEFMELLADIEGGLQ